MRLKSLNLKGFKSFADETIINFSENLIGIVGPNGSGKSNVVDAIRWVLGEQKTSELRLESMSDVLFNGTKTRKEGRVARVTLTFDNTKNVLPTDYNEVSISRILYRDGSSEYRLNDVTCRKKDITSLFLDSGIGSNSYAIISLNMVEDILHDNGGSRRYMIEQAAGISKYKLRKKETTSKLKRTNEDLDRVNDLLFEIEKNMASFEKQAKRTEKFNNLKEIYRTLALDISAIELANIRTSLDDLNKKLKAEKDQKITIETIIANTDAEIQKLKKNNLESEISLSRDQKDFNVLIETLSKKENDKNLINQQIVNAESLLNTNKQDIDKQEKNLESTVQKVGMIKGSITEITAELKEVRLEHERLSKIYDDLHNTHTSLRQKENIIKSEAAQHQQIVRNAQISLETLKTENQLLENNHQQYIDRIQVLRNNSEPIKIKEEKLKEEENTVTTNLTKLTSSQDKHESEVKALEKELDKIKSELQSKRLNHSSIHQRIKFLTNVIEKNEGVPQAVSYLLDKHENITILSDIISVNDEQYTSIVELFFQDMLHHIIVADRASANAYLQEVKDAQKGKVHFLILEEMATDKVTPISKEHLRLQDVISYSDSYSDLISNLSHRVYISQSKERTNNPQVGETTLDMFHYKISSIGFIYGGSNTLFEGVQLGRKQILQKLEDQYVSLTSDLEDYKTTLAKQQQKLIVAHNELKSCKIDIAQTNLKKQNIERELYQLQSQLNNQASNVAQLEAQIADNNAQRTVIAAKIGLQEKDFDKLLNIKSEAMTDEQLSAEIGNIYQKLQLQSQKKEEANRKVYQKENQLQLLQKDLDFQENTQNSINQVIQSKINQNGQISATISEQKNQLESLKSELGSLYTKKDQLQQKLNSYEDTYYKEKGKIFELEKKLSAEQSKLNQKDNLIHNLSEKLSTLKFDAQAIKDRSEIEFSIDIESRVVENLESINIQELIIKRDKTQHRLRSFGEINPMAITAYNEIKERHEYITKERDDILAAQKSLEETMSEIEEAAAAKFSESLALIKANFKEVFQGLFSEDDDCDIVLLDAENPLEARIEIVAKPKGKKPKSINQLSGGEKTLTAASFLFALYLLKPAPFCIFDEVDAPLDDVNVLKFNNIIRKFSDQSQFIVITHNKLTMSEVDILYGVFLKEQGVSGVSAVDFREYDQAEILQSLN